MPEDQQPAFAGWEERYQQQAVETMPRFYPELDDDLKQALDQLGLRSGRALDLGTGPGTQAMQLVRRGFAVTATDISEAAIRLARQKAEAQGLAITWQQDDILSTGLTGPFDLIFDRGCFHVLPPERRQDYVSTVAGLLRPGGYLFLKCFSQLQLGTQGPHRAMNSSYLDRLYVDPSEWRQGWDTRFVELAKTLSPQGLELHTHQENRAARALYEKHGFRAVSFGISPPPELAPDVEYHWRP